MDPAAVSSYVGTVNRTHLKPAVIVLVGLFLAPLLTSVPAQAATWHERTMTEVDAVGSSPNVAASRDGQVMVVGFSQQVGTQNQALARVSTDGGTSWQPVELSGLGVDVGRVRSAVSGDGRTIVMAWGESDGAGGATKWRLSTDTGQTWATTVLDASSSKFSDPEVAVSDGGGTIAATWADGSEALARYSFDAGGTWHDTSLTEPGYFLWANTKPVLTTSGNGRVLGFGWTAARNDQPAHSNTSYVRWTMDSGASWTPRTVAPDAITAPSLATSTDGQVLATGMTRSLYSSDTGVAGMEYSTDGGQTWTDRTLYRTEPQTRTLPVVVGTVSGDGTTMVFTWNQENSKVRSATSTDRGMSWSDATIYTAAAQPYTGVSADGMTIAHTWNNGGIRTKYTSDQGATWTTRKVSEADSSSYDMALTGDGNTLLNTWESPDGSIETEWSHDLSTPNPPPTMRVQARGAGKALAFGKRTKVVSGVQTSGQIKHVKVECLVRGKALKGKKKRNICKPKVRTGKANARVWVKPTCNRGLRIRVGIKVSQTNHPTGDWHRTWKMKRKGGRRCSA